MRKFIIALALALSFSVVKAEVTDLIGPAYTTSNTTLAAAGTDERNCLDYAVWSSTNTITVFVLNGNTTFYSNTVAANTPHAYPPNGEDVCGDLNSTMRINSSASPASTTIHTNYKGYQRNDR